MERAADSDDGTPLLVKKLGEINRHGGVAMSADAGNEINQRCWFVLNPCAVGNVPARIWRAGFFHIPGVYKFSVGLRQPDGAE